MLGLAGCGFFIPFFTAILLCAKVLSLPDISRTLHYLKEEHPVPDQWTCNGRAAQSHVLNLSIALKSGHFEELERHLHESRSLQDEGFLLPCQTRNFFHFRS